MSGNPIICDCFMYDVLTTGSEDNPCLESQCNWPFTFEFSNQIFEDINTIICTDQYIPTDVLSELCNYTGLPQNIYSQSTVVLYQKECKLSHILGRWFSCYVTDCPTDCSCSKNSERAFLTDCANFGLCPVRQRIFRKEQQL